MFHLLKIKKTFFWNSFKFLKLSLNGESFHLKSYDELWKELLAFLFLKVKKKRKLKKNVCLRLKIIFEEKKKLSKLYVNSNKKQNLQILIKTYYHNGIAYSSVCN